MRTSKTLKAPAKLPATNKGLPLPLPLPLVPPLPLPATTGTDTGLSPVVEVWGAACEQKERHETVDGGKCKRCGAAAVEVEMIGEAAAAAPVSGGVADDCHGLPRWVLDV